MKNSQSLSNRPLIFMLAGFAGMTLRSRLYASEVDSKGLLLAGTPTTLLLVALTFVVIVKAYLMGRKHKLADAQGLPGALVSALLAGAILMTAYTAECSLPSLVVLQRIAAGGAVLGLAYHAWRLARREAPSFGSYAAVCVFLCVQLVLCYQLWSERTQVMDYAFGLGAVLCLTLFAYARGAALSGMAKVKSPVDVGLMGIFFCCAAIPHGDLPTLYAAGAAWLGLELFRMERSE